MKKNKRCLMNLLIIIGLIGVMSPGTLFCADFYTHPSGVKISWKAGPKIFPENWRSKKVNAQATRLNKKERQRSLKAVKAALDKYPAAVLKKNLKTVYIVGKLSYFGVKTGGTNSANSVYLANLGARKGYTNWFMENVFHSELSSILLRKHKKKFPKAQWLKVNPRGFKYGKSGVQAIKKGAAGKRRETALLKAGFLHRYATSSMENDLNAMAGSLFMNNEKFWNTIKQYPKVGIKARLTIKFYRKIDPAFSWKYFHSL